MSTWKEEIHNPDILICECLSSEHQMVFTYDSEDNEIYVDIHLVNYRNFWQRIIPAIKYIFGYKSKYGEFDGLIISNSNKHQILNALDKIKEK